MIKKEESLSQKRVVLSLGRLHPLKGLDLLIAAWAEVKKCANAGDKHAQRTSTLVRSPNARLEPAELERGAVFRDGAAMRECENELPWQLVIAGPDEQGTKDKLKGISEKLKMKWCECADGKTRDTQADIIFVGPVQGEEKWDLIKRADIFVLPSRSENFGIVVGEALSCGVPVVTTAVGPWLEVAVGSSSRQLQKGENIEHPAEEREVLKLGEETPRQGEAAPGLIVVETSVEGIAEGLEQMMAISDDGRHEMGRKGSEWVKREFSWDHVAKQMVEAYEEGRAVARPYRNELFC